MQAAGYTLDLYCDNNTDDDCPFRWRQGTHGEFVADGRNCRAECYREARKAGWKMKRNGTDYCPTCAKKLFKAKWYEK